MATKSYWIETFGCQMNVHDSEIMSGLLTKMGYSEAGSAPEADVILVNTCTVRQKPDEQAFSYLGQFKKMKDARPGTIVGVCGCMAQRESEVIHRRAPYVDFLLGPRSIHRLPLLIETVKSNGRYAEALNLYDEPIPPDFVVRKNALSAYVTIIHGCNKKCTFCAVPTARGGERSVLPEAILSQVRGLILDGYKEIMLLGQNVDAYGHDLPPAQRMDLADLLGRVDEFAAPQNARIRFTTNHPNQMTDRLIDAVGMLPSVCEYIHLPIQSGDDAILKRMWRGYTLERYLGIVEKLRAAAPDIAIATDVIVGFPGETEAAFSNTMKAMDHIQFDQAFMFAYSARSNTVASDFCDQIPETVKKRRLGELIELQNGIMKRRNEALVGQTFEVLVEGPSRKNEQKLTGRTRSNKVVVFEGAPSLRGCYVPVQTTKGLLWGFEGTMATQRLARGNHSEQHLTTSGR